MTHRLDERVDVTADYHTPDGASSRHVFDACRGCMESGFDGRANQVFEAFGIVLPGPSQPMLDQLFSNNFSSSAANSLAGRSNPQRLRGQRICVAAATIRAKTWPMLVGGTGFAIFPFNPRMCWGSCKCELSDSGTPVRD